MPNRARSFFRFSLVVLAAIGVDRGDVRVQLAVDHQRLAGSEEVEGFVAVDHRAAVALVTAAVVATP